MVSYNKGRQVMVFYNKARQYVVRMCTKIERVKKMGRNESERKYDGFV